MGIVGDINLIDEGQYSAWVTNMLHGETMYKDFYLQYGPLMVYPYYFFAKVFGISFFSFRLWDVMQIGLSITIFVAILKFLKVKRIFLVFSVVTLLLVPGLNLRYLLGLTILFLCINFCIRQSKIYLIASGILLGAIFYASFEFASISLVLLLLLGILFMIFSAEFKEIIKSMIFFLISFFFSFLIFYLIFFKIGFVNLYFLSTLNFIKDLSGQNLPNGQGLLPVLGASMNISEYLRALVSRVSLFYISLVMLTISSAILIIRVSVTKKTKDLFVLFASLYALLINFSIIGRSGHYFSVFPFCLFVFLYLINSSYEYLKKINVKFFYIMLFLFGIYLVRHILIFRTDLFHSISLLTNVSQIEKVSPIRITKNQETDIKTIQDFVSRRVKKNEKIYILNNDPGLYFLVDRLNATRYDLPLLAETIGMRYEIVNQLKENHPIFIIEDKNAWAVDGVSDRQRMPEVFNYVIQNYKFKTNVGSYIIYSLKPISNKS